MQCGTEKPLLTELLTLMSVQSFIDYGLPFSLFTAFQVQSYQLNYHLYKLFVTIGLNYSEFTSNKENPDPTVIGYSSYSFIDMILFIVLCQFLNT